MKFLIILSMLAAFAFAKPAKDLDEVVPTIVHYEYNNNNGSGPYSFSFETSNGISREESAVYADPSDPEHSSLVVTGSYTYYGADGELYKVQYIADAEGYRIIDNNQAPLNGKL